MDSKNDPPAATAVGDMEDVEPLDATVPDPNLGVPSLSEFASKRFDPNEFRDQARKRITYWLLSLLTLLFIGAFGSLHFIQGPLTFEHVKALLELLLGPLVALVSAATGFYFGAQSGKNGNSP